MSDTNSSLTDRELRNLLNQVLLNLEKQPGLENLHDMEANIVFAHEPVLAVPEVMDDRMANQLQLNLTAKVMRNWLFVSIALVSLTAVTVFLNKPRKAVTASVHSDQPAAKIVPVPEFPLQQKSSVDRKPSGLPESAVVVPLVAANKDTLPISEPVIAFPEMILPTKVQNTVSDFNFIFPVSDELMVHVDTAFEGISRLEVIGLYSDVKVTGTNSTATIIKADIMLKEKSRKKLMEHFEIRFERKGELLKITLEEKKRVSRIFNTGNIRWEGSVDIRVPEKTMVTLLNASGKQALSRLSGESCRIENRFGSIQVDSTTNNLQVTSRSGDVSIREHKGNLQVTSFFGTQEMYSVHGNAEIVSGSGLVSIDQMEGNLKITSSFGDVKAYNISGDVSVHSSSGNMKLKSVEGTTCKLKSGFGDIQVAEIKANLDIQSGSGDVHLNSVKGNIKVHSLYGAQILSSVEGDIQTYSASGNIGIDKGIGFVKAETQFGDIAVEDYTGNVSLDAASGNISGRNIQLTDSAALESGYGNIRFDTRNNKDDLSYDVGTDYGSVRINGESFDNKPTRTKSKVVLVKGRIQIRGYTRSGNLSFN